MHNTPSWLARMISGFIVCMLGAVLYVEWPHGGWLHSKAHWGNYGNSSVAEGYLHHAEKYNLVLAGSSAAGMVPPNGYDAPGVYTLAMQGSSGLTGLKLINCAHASPEVVLVEADYLIRGGDDALLNDLCDPLTLALKQVLPPLSYQYNIVNIFARRKLGKHPAIPEKPAMTPEAWRRTIRDRVDHYAANSHTGTLPLKEDVASLPANEGVKNLLADLHRQVSLLEGRGVKVVFYHTPMAPLLLASNASWRAVIAQSFPDNRIISPPEKTFFYMADGLHFTDYSGLEYYRYLLDSVADRH